MDIFCHFTNLRPRNLASHGKTTKSISLSTGEGCVISPCRVPYEENYPPLQGEGNPGYHLPHHVPPSLNGFRSFVRSFFLLKWQTKETILQKRKILPLLKMSSSRSTKWPAIWLTVSGNIRFSLAGFFIFLKEYLVKNSKLKRWGNYYDSYSLVPCLYNFSFVHSFREKGLLLNRFLSFQQWSPYSFHIHAFLVKSS